MRPDLAISLSLALAFAPPALVVQAQTIDELLEQGVAAGQAGNYREAERFFR